MQIFGAGMAGLLAANVLQRCRPVIHEAQPSLPNNHSALLRFRSDACSLATGIPFKKVEVHKAISYRGQLLSQSSIALNNLYSFKVTGRTVSRSVVNLQAGERFIAPENFISLMAKNLDIQYNSPLGEEINSRTPDSAPAISTIPMPVLMGLVKWKNAPKFEARKIWSVSSRIESCDVYQTIYYPEHEKPYYRASITGNRLIIEYAEQPLNQDKDCLDVLHDFGIEPYNASNTELKEQKYGKLVPLEDPSLCRKFILYMTDRYRIYSLGRFAVWRQLLLDDVCHDIGVIQKLIECRDGYQKAIGVAK